ncbi:cell filamentation protein Fic [Lamprobacter modestohalophilus]|uniref:Protein adenylyltransferase n=1 Tax=Lamprobacter modestohalophilus TaxID=1064514 RepID=A0A9X0WEA7_9GAMM|nr:Fic family protein [Lamprobacter modestohalophilus]MBK1621438.1 cell filamentation protein Fic [Lamprobacter modestohalophilus]
MKRDRQGRYVTISTVGEKAKAFVPAPLPPHPPIDWTPDLRSKFDQALLALGRLDSVSTLLPDTSLFLYMYVRKEAVLSSMIEGTQSSLSDLLLFELEQEPGVPLDDVREVSNYVAALDHGLRLLEEGLPLSLRLLREIHGVLLSKGRGSSQTPGEFRRSQNWIGGTRPGNATFVPPPADAVMECMSKLELFLHDQPEPTPVLLKAAFAHVQFETIHPFLDGNGRLGRLLITLLLCSESVLREPLLYLSLYFKTHRQHYYELLNRVRQTGDWEAWLAFFAEAVIVTATQAVETAQQLLALTSQDRDKISTLGRAAASSLRVHRALMAHPIATSGSLVEETSLTPATVNKALGHLEQLGIVKELTAQKRNRLFSYARYIEIISRGTELPGRSG